jgi:hypothetical protein
MNRIVVIICLLVNCISISFGQAIMKVDFESYDFGEIKEGTIATHDFTITNIGKSSLILSDVKASCGCTTPEWARTPIMPGASGKVKASYNTVNRPGPFNKSVTITSNAETSTNVVFIRGSVVKGGEPEKKYNDAELKLSPKIVLEKTQHNFGKVEKGSKLTLKLNVQNLGRSDLRINQIVSACNCVSFTAKQEFIKSGESGVVELVYSPIAMNAQQDLVYFKTNDITNPSLLFTFKAVVLESLKDNSLLRENNSSVPFK